MPVVTMSHDTPKTVENLRSFGKIAISTKYRNIVKILEGLLIINDHKSIIM